MALAKQRAERGPVNNTYVRSIHPTPRMCYNFPKGSEGWANMLHLAGGGGHMSAEKEICFPCAARTT